MTSVPHDILRSFTAKIFAASGCRSEEAQLVADHLVDANLLGHDSHGIVRVPVYREWLKKGHVLANRRAKRVLDTGAMIVFDGQFGFGQVIGHDAMEAGIERAAEHGLALVAIRNSGHLGRVGAYAEMLALAGLVSLHFVNSSGGGIMVAPHGASERRFSANPISAGAPVPGSEPIVLDISTSAIAEGNIMLALARGEALAPGLILDSDGNSSTDPADFYGPPRGTILPFGAQKGSGLSLFCELLAGSLTGGLSGHPDNPTADRFVNNMLSILISPDALSAVSDFGDDVVRLAAWIRSARPSAPDQSILLPGENGARRKIDRIANGIPLELATRKRLAAVAEPFGIAIPFSVEA